MKAIVILISGRGSNLQAITEACRSEGWPARIVAVIASRRDAAGLEWARHYGLTTEVIDHREFASRLAFEEALAGAIDRYAPDALVLAGFMRVLTPGFVARYHGRMLNIHPSLLPDFPGLATHRRALDAGATIHGATVHFVSAEVDHGPIIAQASVPILPGDDEITLAQRVLEQEHRLYPRALRWFLEGRLRLEGDQVVATRDAEPARRITREEPVSS